MGLIKTLLTLGFQNTVRTVATGCAIDIFKDIVSRTTVTPIGILISGIYPIDRSVASAYFRPLFIPVTLSVCENERESGTLPPVTPHECKDTKKAIEGIKVLVIEPGWNLEH